MSTATKEKPKPRPVFADDAVEARFRSAQELCNAQWCNGEPIGGGGLFCFGPIDGGCGVCHEKKEHAIGCLSRFRLNNGNGYSDRVVYIAKTGKPAAMETKGKQIQIPGAFSVRGARGGRAA